MDERDNHVTGIPTPVGRTTHRGTAGDHDAGRAGGHARSECRADEQADRRRMVRGTAGAVALVLCAWTMAAAQTVPDVRAGMRVWVTTADGRELRGITERISPADLVVRTDAATVSIPMADVRRIEGRDSLLNGAVIGAVAGGASLGGFGLFLSHVGCDIPDGCLRGDIDNIIAIAALGAGAGAAAGALVDRLIDGRRLLYAAPGAAVTLEIGPILGPRRAGARISATWAGW